MRRSVCLGEGIAVTITDFVDSIPALAASYGAVLGVVTLVSGWQALRARRPPRKRRRVVGPLVGVIEHNDDDAPEQRRIPVRWCQWSMAARKYLISYPAKP